MIFNHLLLRHHPQVQVLHHLHQAMIEEEKEEDESVDKFNSIYYSNYYFYDDNFYF